jgi:hypothetical protein
MAETSKERAASETLAIPQWVRDVVDERDQQTCRVCGRHLGDARALHHIRFGGSRQGMGGRRDHDPSNLVTVCWMYGPGKGLPPCHDLVHREKGTYLPLLEYVATHPGVTAFQLRRWRKAEGDQREHRTDRG